jgi:hypothetical protein
MAGLEHELRSKLFRAFCPDSLVLGEFELGSIKGKQADEIRKHLMECPHCRREIEQLRGYLSGLSQDIEYSLGEQVKIWIARRLPAPGGPALAPAFGVRGEQENVLRYQAGSVELTLEIQEDPQKAGLKVLLGLVTGMETDGLRAFAWQAGKLAAQAPVDELGNLIVSGLSAGVYDLILSGGPVEIHVQEVTI